MPIKRAELKELKATHGNKSLGTDGLMFCLAHCRTRVGFLQRWFACVTGDVTVNMAIGGMRGIKGMIWEPSLLDAGRRLSCCV